VPLLGAMPADPPPLVGLHWRRPHQPSERELLLLDVIVRQAADLLERTEILGELREIEQRYRQVSTELRRHVGEEGRRPNATAHSPQTDC
jgi:GAF domain-containing protein